MFLEIVAEVTFDRDAKDWVVRGPGVATVGLELHDPNAKDELIIAGLYSSPSFIRQTLSDLSPKPDCSLRSHSSSGCISNAVHLEVTVFPRNSITTKRRKLNAR